MNEQPDTNLVKHSETEVQHLQRNTITVNLVIMGMALIVAAFLITSGESNLLMLTILPILIIVAGIIAIWLTRRGQNIAGSAILLGVLAVISLSIPFVESGSGILLAAGMIGLGGIITTVSWPKRLTIHALILNLAIASCIILIDIFGSDNRIQGSIHPAFWFFAVGALVIYLFFIARKYSLLDVRTKIVLAILIIGIISLSSLSFFALNRTQAITESISNRLETNVSLLAEEKLVNTSLSEASRVNSFFSRIEGNVNDLAKYELSLQNQKDILAQGSYWDASLNLIQMNDGKYGNSAKDKASVFVPAKTNLTPDTIAELNTSAYLDFTVPQLLEENSFILATYYANKNGTIRYYPNVDLASLLPPDFNVTERPYYKIATPSFNPQKLTRWSIPYVDAAGGGLVVTASSPIYVNNSFIGIMASDILLSQITEQIAAIKVGDTGYAFMIDDAGRIIAMTSSGYALLGIDPTTLPKDEYYKQTLLGHGNVDLRSITTRMVAGGNGLNIIKVGDVDNYIAYSPIKSTGYSIAIVVPVSEMQAAIISAKNETQAQTRSAIRLASIIVMITLLATIGISVGLGQLITTPIRQLTDVAAQVAAGDLHAQASVITTDEIGKLAGSFNTMTARLSETLGGLEKNIEERTSELVSANAKYEKRAKQFESISLVARAISSTRDLDVLLPQITTVISREFEYYHVGIFLIDDTKRYAVLSAANSEGGQVMLARSHRLEVGGAGLVGYVTNVGKARVALDTGQDAAFFNNPDLPNTHSEITLPLRTGEEVIGALDVQSTEVNAFSQEDVNILNTLADQVSIAIQNARQFEETRKALREANLLSRQFVQTNWQQFTKSRKIAGVVHTGAKSSLLYTSEDKSSLNTGPLKAGERGARLSLPLKLRGEVIGSVDVRSPDEREWDQDEIEIVTAIVERSVIAMENARLIEESQKSAAKEHTVGEISAKISAHSDIDDLLKTAIQELGRTLPGMDIAIQFKNEDNE